MATSSIKKTIVKKCTKKFRRFQKSTLNKTKGNYFIRLRTGWRKPRGIDNRARRKFRGTTILPNIGYGSSKKTRHMMPNGFYRIVVNNAAELEPLLMQNTKFAVEIASKVSSKKRQLIVTRAEELGLFITNKFAKLQVAESDSKQ